MDTSDFNFNVYVLNLIAVFCHLILSIFTLSYGLKRDVWFESTSTSISPDVTDGFRGVQYGGIELYPYFLKSGFELSVTWIVFTFCLLSSIFQFLCGYNRTKYIELMNNKQVNYLRYIEYSFSASLMMILIGLEVGILDWAGLIGFLGCTWSCMMFGLIGEYFFMFERNGVNIDMKDGLKWKNVLSGGSTTVSLYNCGWISHFCGWFVMFLPFFVVWVRVIGNSLIPSGVIIVIVLETLMFMGFGLTQYFYFSNYNDANGAIIELIYIFQSLLSKSILVFFVYSVVLV